jgi:hypothetical protein
MMLTGVIFSVLLLAISLTPKVTMAVVSCASPTQVLPGLARCTNAAVMSRVVFANMHHVLLLLLLLLLLVTLTTGHTGGGVVRIPDPSVAKMYEYSGGVTGADLASHASHGIGIDYNTNRMVTADYLDVASALSEAK